MKSISLPPTFSCLSPSALHRKEERPILCYTQLDFTDGSKLLSDAACCGEIVQQNTLILVEVGGVGDLQFSFIPHCTCSVNSPIIPKAPNALFFKAQTFFLQLCFPEKPIQCPLTFLALPNVIQMQWFGFSPVHAFLHRWRGGSRSMQAAAACSASM